MKPSDKDPLLEEKLSSMFGFNRRSYIQANRCVPAPIGCGGPADHFKDEASCREYAISGLCQACQNKLWKS